MPTAIDLADADRMTTSDSKLLTRAAVVTPALLYLAILYVLTPPAPLEPGIDPSYQAMLTELFLRGAHFGKDVIFTFGPWGFLLQPRGNPDIFLWSVSGRALLSAGMIIGGIAIAERHVQRAWTQCAWLFLLVMLADPVWVLPFLAFALATTGAPRNRALLRDSLLLVACGLAASVKFTSLMLVVSLALVFAIDGTVRFRRSLARAVVLIASAVFFFVVTGQTPGDLADYLSASVVAAGSYTLAMGLPSSAIALALGAVLCLAVPLTYVVHAFRERRSPRVIPLLVWAPLYFFLAFKQAFVRNDASHMYTALVHVILPACLVTAVQLWKPGNTDSVRAPSRLGFRLVLLFAAGVLILAATTLRGSNRMRGVFDRIQRAPLSFSGERRRSAHQRQLAALRHIYIGEDLRGSVSFAGVQLFMLPLWQSDFRSMPVLQTYAAYNPYLSRKNVEFLSGPSAPDRLLLAVEPIDSHFPTMEDSLTWIAIRAHYVPERALGDYLQLRRTLHASVVDKHLLVDRRLRVGERLSLPSASPLWVEADMPMTVAGKIVAFLLKGPTILMNVEGSRSRDYRLVPENASSGFLLSPVIDTPESFRTLYSSESEPGELATSVSFRLSDSALARLVSLDVSVRVYSVVIRD